ncbi:MAG: helix-turn-helix domain-containing protein [Clostridia bacterium]|nr:helix-turn-helix domain-containing protein [Clostridia bacterium]
MEISTGEKIFELRKAKGISQEELAEKVGVSRQTVHKWETDSVKPSYENLLALSEALGVEKDFIDKPFTPLSDNEKAEIAVSASRSVKATIYKILVGVTTVIAAVAIFITVCLGIMSHPTNTGDFTELTIEVSDDQFVPVLLATLIVVIGDIVFVILLAKINSDIKKEKCKPNVNKM